MDEKVKNKVEAFYRPTLKSWEEYTEEEIDRKIAASEEDIVMGRVLTQEEAEARIMARFPSS